MAIGSSTNPNFNIQAAADNQSLVYDSSQNAFVNANISVTGTVTGATNVGAGKNLFKSLVGTDLSFRSLVAGTGVTLTENATDITLSATGTITTAGNLGSGKEIFAQVASGNLQLRSLLVGTGLATSNTANEITISVDSANLNAGTLGGNAASVFLTKADNLASVGSVATARTNLDVFSKSEANTAFQRTNADYIPDADNLRSLGSNSNRFSDIFAVEFHGLATQSGTTNSITNHNLGNLSNVDEAGISNGKLLQYNGTKWVGVTLDADSFAEGSTNLYFTNARADARAQLKIDALIGGAPGALDTLNELAAAINDDASYASSITSSLSGKEPVVTAGTTAQYYRGDKSFQTLNTDAVPEGTNKYINTSSIDALTDVNTSGGNAPTDGQVLTWDNLNSYWKPSDVSGGGGGAGDITAVVAGTGLTGGSSTGTATLNVDVGTTADKIVQLNGSAQLPAVSGALLTSINTDNLTEGSSNLFYTDARFDSRLGTKTTANLTEGANLYYTDARVNTRVSALGSANWNTAYGWGDHGAAGYQTTSGLNASVDTHLNQSNPTSGYVLSWNGSDYAWVAQSGGAAGDITAVVAGTGLTGGASSGSATLNVDVGTTASKIVQLDGSAKLPAVDGSNLTNLPSGSTTFVALTDTPANFTGGANKFVKVNAAGNALEYVADPGYLTSVPAQSFASLTSKPTTIAGYGITDALALGTSSTTALAGNTTFSFASLTGKPTTLAGYGITDGYSNSKVDDRITNAGVTSAKVTNWDTAYSWGNHASAGYLTSVPAQSFASLTGKPTTISGYGITNLNASIDTHLNQSNPTSGYVLSWNGSDYAWVTNAGYTNTDFDNRLATKTTANLTEGANLYYTDARANSAFDTRLATKSTTNLSEGTNLYFTNARADARVDAGFTAKSTSDLSEGTNKYYTDVRADARITNALIDEDNMASDSATKLPSQQSVKAYVDSQVASENELSEMNDVTISGASTNQFLQYNGSAWVNSTAGAGTPGGSTGQVQFNDVGSMAGDPGFTYNKTTDTITVGAIETTGASSEVSSSGALTIKTASAGNIIITPHSTGDIVLDGQQWPQADGSANQILKTDGSGQLSWVADSGGPADTDALSEGSSNLYHTTARAISAIQGTNINMGSNSITTTGKVLYSNVYSALVDLPSASTYHGMFAHVHATGKGYFAHSGNWIELANHSQISNSSNWDTAYGWGNHAGAGYLTSVPAQSFASLTGKPTTLAGYGITDGYSNAKVEARISAASIQYLTDVATVSASDDGKILYYDHSATSFKWKTDAAGGGTISALTDTTISGASNGQVLKYNGSAWVNAADTDTVYSTFNSDFDTRLASKNTANLTEGTNLYFTNARADARISNAVLSAISNVHTSTPTDGQVLTWDDGNSYWKPADEAGGEAFKTISVSGQTDVVADASDDTLTLVAGSGIVLTTNAGSDSVTIASSTSGGGTDYEEFKINYATNGQLNTITNTSSGISGVTIDSAAGGDITVTFTGYTTPPLTFSMYGYNYAANEYNFQTVGSGSMTLKKVPGGGSSGSPTAFGSFATMKIRCAEAETGASRSFGTTTHAWVRFVMGA